MKYSILISLLVILSSCFISKNKKKEITVIENTIPAKIIQDSTLSKLLISSNGLDTSVLQLDYQYFLKPATIWQDSINKYIADFMLGNCYFEIPENLKISCDESKFKAGLDTFYTYAYQDHTENEYFGGLWALESRSSIDDTYSNFATLYLGVYTFTGGAHGNSFSGNFNFDKTTGNTLKLSDFIIDTTEFNTIAEKCFRKQAEISENENLSDLGFWFEENIFKCNDNFFITDEGFNFTFNTYEIAPYAFGSFEFSVPFTLSNHLLKRDLSKK